MDRRYDKEAPSYSGLGRGRFTRGKWQCECMLPAVCRTTQKPGRNLGRKYWKCSKIDDERCYFFLWVEHEDAAKAWLKISQPPPLPETPKKTSFKAENPDSGPLTDQQAQVLETPFTKAKRKAVPRDLRSAEINDSYQDLNPDVDEIAYKSLIELDELFTSPRQPLERTGKAARTSTFTTPGQSFTERLKSYTISSSTPKSRDGKSPSEMIASRLQPRETSPTPARFNNKPSLFLEEEESDLTAKVLGLIRADLPKLKASTESQVRHEINLALDISETKVRRYKVTIKELKDRVDELETMVLNLT